MELKIDKLVKAHIETEIVKAFRDAPEAIDELVKAALSEQVDQYGGKPSYGDEKMPYLTFLAKGTIQSIARKAVLDWFSEKEAHIRSSIQAHMESGAVTDQLVTKLLSLNRDEWRMRIEFTIPKPKERDDY